VPQQIRHALQGDASRAFFRREVRARPQPAPGLSVGKQVGDFRLLSLIGAGGMGQVWEAEQLSLHRRVAVKFVRPERVSDRQLELFAREARAGGRLSHPGIVTVHGHGHSDGQAWIAMEFVEGTWTLKDFLNEAARAKEVPRGYDAHVTRFVAEIADAMHAAHEAGVIHRDLKPQNVLITSDDRPKVTDFGLAKITDESALSETGDFAGTYFYMSPEQVLARRMGIDHRTDIFSLGVLLYELLALRRPFEGDTVHQVAAQIVTKEPPDIRTIRSRIPHDLAVIAGKALEKDRDKRFQTMKELAADLRRHLANEPILARPPTPAERLAKWTKRNPAKSVAAGIVSVTFTAIALLLAANVRTNRKLSEERSNLAEANKELEAKSLESEQRRISAEENEKTARQREQEARASEARANRVTELVQTALVSSDPNQGGSQGLLVSEAMDQAIRQLERGELKDDPQLEASLQTTISEILLGNGHWAEALAIAERALTTRMDLCQGDHADVATSLNNVAICLEYLGRSSEALPKFEAALEMRERLFEGDHTDLGTSLGNVAGCLDSLGRSSEALPKYEAALEMYQRLCQGNHPDVATGMNNVAYCLESLGRSSEALPHYQAALEMREQLFQGDHPDVAASLNNVGACLESLGQSSEALPKFEAALQMYQRLFEGDHPSVAMAVNNVAGCLDSLGRSSEALSKYEAALQMRERLSEGDHPDVAASLNNIAACLESLGQSSKALLKLEAALEMYERLFEDDHPSVATGMSNVAACLESLGRTPEALAKYDAALEMRRRLFEGDHPSVASSLNNVASCLNSLGRSSEALPKYEAALEMYERLFQKDHPDVAMGLNNVAGCLDSLGRSAEALPKYEAALEMYERLFQGDHHAVATGLDNVAMGLDSLGRSSEALHKHQAALEMRERLFEGDHPDVAFSLNNLAACLQSLGRHEEALPLAERADAMVQRLLPEAHPVRSTISGRLQEIRAALEESH
jgi:tetratricopeptide (TPR) repeat protein